MTKRVVPLTFGPGGERIGEAEFDDANPYAPVTMRFSDPREAERMAELVMDKMTNAISIEPSDEKKPGGCLPANDFPRDALAPPNWDDFYGPGWL